MTMNADQLELRISALTGKLDELARVNPKLANNLRTCLAAAQELPEDRDLPGVLPALEEHAERGLMERQVNAGVESFKRKRLMVLIALGLAGLLIIALVARLW